MRRIGASLPGSVRRLALAAALLAASASPSAWVAGDLVAAARADEAWKDEFAQVCAKTQDAMTLSTPELEALVARCDKLRPVVEKLDEPLRKVYSRRLKGCRDLYQFVLDSRAPGAAK